MRRKILKEEILNAGKELIHTYGYHAVSIKDITEKVSIPKGSFYNHFGSKHEFLKDAIEEYALESYLLIKKHLIDSDAPALTRLSNYFDEAILFYGNNKSRLNGCLIGNICQELANVDSVLQQQLELNLSGSKTLIGKLLLEAQASKTLILCIDPYEMADFITNSWQGALLRMKAVGNDTPLIAFKRILFNQILTT